jgi:hypothetical protein
MSKWLLITQIDVAYSPKSDASKWESVPDLKSPRDLIEAAGQAGVALFRDQQSFRSKSTGVDESPGSCVAAETIIEMFRRLLVDAERGAE